jgi:hypothetical protein
MYQRLNLCFFSTLACVIATGITGMVLLFQHAAAQGQEGKDGRIKGSGAIIRDGSIVLKDFHDSYEGTGWVAGTVVSTSVKTLVVSVPKGKKQEYTVTIDAKTSVCVAKAIATDGLSAIAGFKPGQRVSVAFRKGSQIADRVVDQSYEVLAMPGADFTGTAQEPSMPHCD